jgi:hypothetical protein
MRLGKDRYQTFNGLGSVPRKGKLSHRQGDEADQQQRISREDREPPISRKFQEKPVEARFYRTSYLDGLFRRRRPSRGFIEPYFG